MLIDISRGIHAGMTAYPGDPQPVIRHVKDVEHGDDYSFTLLELHSHIGTHLDAPRHFIPGGACLGDYAPEAFCPLVEVLDCRGRLVIDAAMLKGMLKRDDTAVLLHTNASDYPDKPYRELHPGLSEDAAELLIRRRGRLVGIDYVSIEADGNGTFPVHRALLGAGFLLLEGLLLRDVEAGLYRLFCQPLKLERAEAAPCRAFLSSETGPL